MMKTRPAVLNMLIVVFFVCLTIPESAGHRNDAFSGDTTPPLEVHLLKNIGSCNIALFFLSDSHILSNSDCMLKQACPSGLL